MTSFSKNMQSDLNKAAILSVPQIEEVAESQKDGSYKFILKAADGSLIESILMLAPGRVTICVSCMVGCPLKCRFCATGSEIGFKRKLDTSEIMGQILAVEKYAQENKLATRISNVVFMGMGEPFLNLNAVGKAIAILLDENLFGISKTRITVSTAGVGPGIAAFINKFGINLAVSLHFPTNELRSEYMPINKAFSLEKLISELRRVKLGKQDYITVEYIMLDGINDQIEHAKLLVRLLSTVKIKFNLIPYNPTEKSGLKPSSDQAIKDFAEYLHSKSFVVTVRRSHGVDVQGGCGQFALKRFKV